MSLVLAIAADIRARVAYIPPCPLCSFLGHDIPDVLHRPSFRMATLKGGEQVVKLTGCCKLSTPSDDDNLFETEADAAAWWRQRRMVPHPDIATEERRKLTIERLRAANLEPIE